MANEFLIITIFPYMEMTSQHSNFGVDCRQHLRQLTLSTSRDNSKFWAVLFCSSSFSGQPVNQITESKIDFRIRIDFLTFGPTFNIFLFVMCYFC